MMRLLADSLDSYERNGRQSADKVDHDARAVLIAASDLRVELAARS